MDLSVVVCTYNRANSLAKCLSQLLEHNVPTEVMWEVIVVDNNSIDGTEKVVEQLASQYPIAIRYVKESQQGLNYARNRGVVSSKSKYFAFIDDDILVRPGWLGAIYTSLEKNDADSVGGRIHLDKSLKLPSWIRPDMYGFLGYKDLGEEPFQMDGIKEYPFGGNMAFNRRVVEKIGLFNPNVGRKGTGQKRGELFKGAETDYLHRLAAIGGRIFYEPNAIVFHQILPFQLKKNYFRTIHYNYGYQKAYHDQTASGRNLCGIPLFLFPQLARGIARYIFQVVCKGPNWAFRQQMTVSYFLGMVSGYFHRGRKPSLES